MRLKYRRALSPRKRRHVRVRAKVHGTAVTLLMSVAVELVARATKLRTVAEFDEAEGAKGGDTMMR